MGGKQEKGEKGERIKNKGENRGPRILETKLSGKKFRQFSGDI